MSQTQIVAEPGVPQILITREFDAPRELVYRAHMDPDLLVKWLGPRELTTTIDRWDVRDGGMWRYVSTDTDGNAVGFHGVFHGDPSPDASVQTFEFEGMPGHVAMNTATFEDHEGKTLLRINCVFQSVEDRDGMVASGMESGMNEGFECLEELLSELASVG
jgi:uncharacterized protein YndB with AHSA1/START domain